MPWDMKEKILRQFEFFEDEPGQTIDADIEEALSLFTGEGETAEGEPVKRDYKACIDRLYTAYLRAQELEDRIRQTIKDIREHTGNIEYHAQNLG